MPTMPTNPDATSNSRSLSIRSSGRAFTLIEILVVVAVLAILIGMAFRGATAMTESAKVRETEGLLQALTQAIDAYKLEVGQSRAGGGAVAVLYNGSPPDDWRVFTFAGANLAGNVVKMVSGNPVLPDLTETRDATSGAMTSPNGRSHGDVRAMVLAMRLRSPKASEILDGINEKYRVNEGNLFFNPGDGTDPIPLTHYVDGWGTPIEYFSVCTSATSTDPRERAAFGIVHNSNVEAVLVSYGPNGPDQFTGDFFNDPAYGDTSVISDFNGGCTNCTVGKIDHILNQDNIYSSETLKERMK